MTMHLSTTVILKIILSEKCTQILSICLKLFKQKRVRNLDKEPRIKNCFLER